MKSNQRTLDQIRNHYEVEKELAARLLKSSRAERTRLFRTLYDELFARVPDHPRLTRRNEAELSERAVAAQLALLRRQLEGVRTFLEFAPGDCRLSFEVCRFVEKVYAVDISDQTGGVASRPANFELVLYDGYHLDLPPQTIDLAFSYQFLEHLHPDDVIPHFQMIKRLLRPGGAYIFSTPHRYSGPHDISAYFSDTPQGFHFQEWTYRELGEVLEAAGFAAWFTYRFGRPRRSKLVNGLTLAVESAFGLLPRRVQRRVSRRLFQGVTMMAVS